MATRTESIIAGARDRLGDTRGERWSDDNLLRLLNEAQKDIAIQTNIFSGTYNLPLQDGKFLYNLPSDVLLIRRATFGDAPIAIVSYDRMDEYLAKAPTMNYAHTEQGIDDYIDFPRQSWDTDTGSSIDAIVFDNRNLLEIRVYPIPQNLADIVYPFESASPFAFVGDEMVGTVVDIEGYSFSSVYGFVSNLFDPETEQEVFDSPYGVVTELAESNQTVSLWYVRSPRAIESASDNPELHPLFDSALKHYVVSHAFDDDVDTKSAAKAARAYNKYERDLKIAMRTASKSGIQVSSRQTTYRSPFNG